MTAPPGSLDEDVRRDIRLTGISAQDLGIASKFGSAAIITVDLMGKDVRPTDDDEEDEARRKVGAARFDKR